MKKFEIFIKILRNAMWFNKEPISWLDGNQPNGAVISCDLGKTNTDL